MLQRMEEKYYQLISACSHDIKPDSFSYFSVIFSLESDSYSGVAGPIKADQYLRIMIKK